MSSPASFLPFQISQQPAGQQRSIQQQSIPPLVPLRLAHLALIHSNLSLRQTELFYATLLYCILQQQQQPSSKAGVGAGSSSNVTPTSHMGRHLYASALLNTQQPYSAIHVTKNGALEGCVSCAEIYARACENQGRNREGRDMLEKSIMLRNSKSQDTVNGNGIRSGSGLKYSNAASGSSNLHANGILPDHHLSHPPLPPTNDERESGTCCLLAALSVKGNDSSKAMEHYQRALTLNPFCWEAFVGLCELGVAPTPNQLFVPVSPKAAKALQPTRSQPTATGLGFFTPSDGAPPSSFHGTAQLPNINGAYSKKNQELLSSSPPTPNQQNSFTNHPYSSQPLTFSALGGVSPSHPAISMTEEFLEKPPAMKRLRGATAPTTASQRNGITGLGVAGMSAGVRAATGRNASSKGTGGDVEPIKPRSTNLSVSQQETPGIRRSSRLSSSTQKTRPLPAPREKTKKARTTIGEAGSRGSGASDYSNDYGDLGSPKSTQSHDETLLDLTNAEAIYAADVYILDLTKVFAKAIRYLKKYECKEAIAELDNLPDYFKESAWVCAMMGKAHFEMVEYVKAKRAFVEARRIDPFRLQDMEVFSTLLYHLEDEVQLSFLAQELVSVDRKSPEAWIAVGNCFSRQGEHDEAMRCFRRAAQVSPRFAYANTLSGHEALAMEEYDRAIGFFQTAVRTDKKHYNAWYGLGTAYLRKDKLRHAEHHFNRAVEINASNPVLMCCVGQVLERRGKKEEALAVYAKAAEIAPENTMVRFRRARVLIALQKLDSALVELLFLVSETPNEFNVFFLLGKVYRLLGDTSNSTKYFAHAIDLDPKAASVIKAIQAPESEDGTMEEV